jgi:hypothetical protein
VIPAVAPRRVAQHQLLEHVEAPWLHVHFRESAAQGYRDPLRPAAPWPRDAPQVTRRGRARVASHPRRSPAPSRDRRGAPDAAAPVPAPWDSFPSPARLRWRPARLPPCGHGTPIDLAETLFPGRVPASRRARAKCDAGRASTASWPGRGAPGCGVRPRGRGDERRRTGRRVLPFAIANDV